MTSLRTFLTAALLGGIFLSGCSLPTETKRDDDGNVVEANENASVMDMQVGDCYGDFGSINSDESTVFETLPALPCDEPHDYEVFAGKKIEAKSLPAESMLWSDTEEFCMKKFASFVGISYDDSTLDLVYFYPTSESWDLGDRDMTCLIEDPDQRTAGTLKNAKR